MISLDHNHADLVNSKKSELFQFMIFCLKLKKLVAFRNASILEVNYGCEELSYLDMHTLGDCLDAGYEKVREALIKVAKRDGPWHSHNHEGCSDYFDGFVSILARFGLRLERKLLTEENEEPQEPEPLPKNLQGHSFHFYWREFLFNLLRWGIRVDKFNTLHFHTLIHPPLF